MAINFAALKARRKEEGSSATSNVRDVTDVTDVSPSEEGGRKKSNVISHQCCSLRAFGTTSLVISH
ncbi:hypothetical protein [Microcoleus sp. S36a_D1]|uniref:hypothetical protein n=1 Tax=Microcoleus sp. S36a_D1 TaxID=3055416 RepID=UPI002FD5784A